MKSLENQLLYSISLKTIALGFLLSAVANPSFAASASQSGPSNSLNPPVQQPVSTSAIQLWGFDSRNTSHLVVEIHVHGLGGFPMTDQAIAVTLTEPESATDYPSGNLYLGTSTKTVTVQTNKDGIAKVVFFKPYNNPTEQTHLVATMGGSYRAGNPQFNSANVHFVPGPGPSSPIEIQALFTFQGGYPLPE